MEITSDKLIAYPDNLSSRRTVRADIRKEKSEIYDRMEQISKDMNQHQVTMAKLTAANDQVSAFKLAAEQANLTAINKQVDLAVTAGQIDATKKETFVNLGIADGELLTATLAAIPTKKSLNAIIEAEKTGASEVNSVDEFAALSTEKQLAFKKQDPEGYKKLFTKN